MSVHQNLVNINVSLDHSFLRKNSANSTWHFAEFCSSLWQFTANSMVNSQLKRNWLCCSKYCYLSVLTSHRMCSLR